MKVLSLLCFLVALGGILGIYAIHALFSTSPAVIAVQGAAVALMVWARVTFGLRSFHATANPTSGGLVTTGPYAYLRHPIYSAVLLFVTAGVLAHPSWAVGGLWLVVFLGSLGRMIAEERMVVARYPDYVAYAARTKRMIPYVL